MDFKYPAFLHQDCNPQDEQPTCQKCKGRSWDSEHHRRTDNTSHSPGWLLKGTCFGESPGMFGNVKPREAWALAMTSWVPQAHTSQPRQYQSCSKSLNKTGAQTIKVTVNDTKGRIASRWHNSKVETCQAWWHTSVTPASGAKWKDQEFQVSLGYRPSLFKELEVNFQSKWTHMHVVRAHVCAYTHHTHWGRERENGKIWWAEISLVTTWGKLTPRCYFLDL